MVQLIRMLGALEAALSPVVQATMQAAFPDPPSDPADAGSHQASPDPAWLRECKGCVGRAMRPYVVAGKTWDTYNLGEVLKKRLQAVFLPRAGLADLSEEAEALKNAVEALLTVRNFLGHASPLPQRGEIVSALGHMRTLLVHARKLSAPLGMDLAPIDACEAVVGACRLGVVVGTEEDGVEEETVLRLLLLRSLGVFEEEANKVMRAQLGVKRFGFAQDEAYKVGCG